MEQVTCPNPDCRVAETGKCVEGFEIGECPHQKGAVAAPAPSDIKSDESAIGETKPSDIPISSGSVLTVDKATDVLCAGPTRVITIIGPAESGKTTLALSLYEAFQHSPFGLWSFSGSLTLPAFEERLHLSRVECGNTMPHTPHTSRSDGLGFLHLAICNDESGRLDLLISERSGEFYTAVANSEEECENLYEVSRSDYVILLVDGKGLASDARHGVKSEIIMMVATLVEAGILGSAHRVGVVLSKYDYVKAHANMKRIEDDFADLVETIQKRFGKGLAQIKPFKIAARRENDTVQTMFGVMDLLEECSHSRPKIYFIPPSPVPLDRSFHRLLTRGGN